MQNASFFNICRIPFNNWSNSQIIGTLCLFAGLATKSGRGLILSWTLRIRDFLVFILMLPFFKIFCFCFLMLITDNIFLFTAALMTAPIYVNMWINVDTVCFQRTKAFLWLWGRILVKLTEFSSFAFNCYSFGSLNFNFNRSKIKISYSGGASELCLFIRLLPNVSHVIECIFKEISDFLNLSIYIILVNILLILSKYRSAFPPYKRKTFLWPIVLTEGFLALVTTSFWYKIFWFLCVIAHFCCCFCFFCKLSHFLTL